MTAPGDCIASIALPATGFRATVPARTPPILILIPAIFATECSNTRPLPGQPSRSGKIYVHSLQSGIPGTAMPSLAKLPDEQIKSLVEYVKYLSIRGETEQYLLQTVVDEHAALPLDQGKVLAEGVRPTAMSWDRAEDMTIVSPPAPRADTLDQLSVSIDRGRELFRTMGAQCFLCHGWTGKGDGQRTTFTMIRTSGKLRILPSRPKTSPCVINFPFNRCRGNLTEGVFHGGDRPIDLYRRISVGIKGTPMPAAGPAPGRKSALLGRGRLGRRKLRGAH